MVEQHHDLEEVRALLRHSRIDTIQIYTTSIKRRSSSTEIRALPSSLKKRRRRQSLNATNTPSPATIRISAPGAKRRQGREDPIDRPMEHPAEILGSITRLTSRSRRSSWTVLQYPDPAHPLLLPERRAGLRGHARRDTSDGQGGRFRRSGSGTAGRRSGRNSQRARRASVVRTTTRSERRGRPSGDLSDSTVRRRSPRRSFTRISAAYQSLGSIPLPSYDVH